MKNKKPKVFRAVFVTIIQLYQKILSPHLPKSCRFYPSCSEYSVLAVKKYGAIQGLVLSCWRVLRCNPFSKGGVDLPK